MKKNFLPEQLKHVSQNILNKSCAFDTKANRPTLVGLGGLTLFHVINATADTLARSNRGVRGGRGS